MRRFKAKITVEKSIQIHSDLSNAAHYFLEKSRERMDNDDRGGIAFDILAGFVMLSFAAEAKLNYIGQKIVSDWDESWRHPIKINQVFDTLDLASVKSERPFNCLSRLQKIRNRFAHGKPLIISLRDERVVTDADIAELGSLEHGWEKQINLNLLDELSRDFDEVWDRMLQLGRIERFDTLTQGTVSVEYLGDVE